MSETQSTEASPVEVVETTAPVDSSERLLALDKLSVLSSREHQILIQMARGVSPEEIAQKYGLSVKTVSTYRARIIEKTKIKSNARLAILAFQAGLVRGVVEL